MWIKFSATEEFAIKIFVGGVNAISGVPIGETTEEMERRIKTTGKIIQDYAVVPDQPWLDGIAAEDGSVKQFVAMPKGSGYSVEVQVTGEEKIGGLQFEVIPTLPPKKGCPDVLTVRGGSGVTLVSQDTVSKLEHRIDLHGRGLNDMSTILDLKKLFREEFDLPVGTQRLHFSKLTPWFSENSPGNEVRFADLRIPSVSITFPMKYTLADLITDRNLHHFSQCLS
jgi:hypothetical protein